MLTLAWVVLLPAFKTNYVRYSHSKFRVYVAGAAWILLYPQLIASDIVFAAKDLLDGARDPRVQQYEFPRVQHHSATSTTVWLEIITYSPWPSRLRDQAGIDAPVRAVILSRGTLTPQKLFGATSLRASVSDIETLAEKVAQGLAVAKAVELLFYRRLAPCCRTPDPEQAGTCREGQSLLTSRLKKVTDRRLQHGACWQGNAALQSPTRRGGRRCLPNKRQKRSGRCT